MTILDHRGRPLEVRDPKGATRHVAWQAVNQRMVPAWDAGGAVERGYNSIVYLKRAIDVRASALAGLPLRAGADPDKPKDHNPKAPILRLLRANPNVSLARLVTHALRELDVTGRYGWELDLDRGGRPVMVYPLSSIYLDAIPTEGGRTFWQRFEYRVTNRPEAVERLTVEQVHYDWRPSMADYRQPESLLQSMRLPLSVLLASDLYAYSFLVNGGIPSHLVIHEDFARKEDETAFRNQFRSEFGGASNAGKVLFVAAEDGDPAGAVDVKTLGLSQKDARTAETYAQEIKAVSVGTGVPMSKLGDSSARTFDNASQEDLNFWEMMVDVGGELADGINRELAGRVGSEVVWFDYSEVPALQPKRPFRDVDLAAVLGKLVTINEGREQVGLPPRDDEDADALDAPGPDRPALPAPEQPGTPVAAGSDNVQGSGAASRHSEVATVAAPDDQAPAVPVGHREAAHDGGQRSHPGPVPTIPARGTRETAEDRAERRARTWRSVDAQLATLERQWERSWRTFFARQEKGTIDRLTKQRRGKQIARDLEARAAVDVARIFDPKVWAEQAADFIRGLFETVATTATARMADRFERDLDLDLRVAEFIEERTAWLADEVNATTRDAIAGQLTEGAEQGEGIDKLADRVRAVFADATDTRAETIARSSVISAYNYAADAAADELGPDVVAGKEWIATVVGPSADRTRPDHRDADGQVVRMGQSFRVGESRLAFPGDPTAPADQVIRCRCAVGHLTPEEMNERGAGRIVELRVALTVVDLVADGLVTDVRRAVEVAA